ncbi:hypothetical protein [Staphylococcus phage VB-SauS-SA2]|nr:hypothetical protein [Staphylococcus phage VB-SauS-SA2]
MNNLKITKEYNNASSNKNNMDVFDIYVNDWGILQYGFKYNEFHGLYEIHFMTTGKRVTGLTYEKMEKVLHKELEYQIELFRKSKRI